MMMARQLNSSVLFALSAISDEDGKKVLSKLTCIVKSLINGFEA